MAMRIVRGAQRIAERGVNLLEENDLSSLWECSITCYRKLILNKIEICPTTSVSQYVVVPN
jgi:hypothetical protein